MNKLSLFMNKRLFIKLPSKRIIIIYSVPSSLLDLTGEDDDNVNPFLLPSYSMSGHGRVEAKSLVPTLATIE